MQPGNEANYGGCSLDLKTDETGYLTLGVNVL